MAEDFKQPQIFIAEARHLLQTLRGADLTRTIYQIEKSVKGVSAEKYSAVLSTSAAKAEVLGASGLVKQLAGSGNHFRPPPERCLPHGWVEMGCSLHPQASGVRSRRLAAL
jgi:hypothetical protein